MNLVRDAVLSRLMRCSVTARELAELVSISPRKTDRRLIETMIGARGAAIDEGVARGLLSSQGDVVSFRHEQIGMPYEQACAWRKIPTKRCCARSAFSVAWARGRCRPLCAACIDTRPCRAA